MQHIIKTAQQLTHNYKTNKSIFNILSGKKSHQTFFDACSQQQLSLYHSLPHLKYPSFERFLEQSQQNIKNFNIITHPRFTFDSMAQTFNALQLLVQTISNTEQECYKFIPIAHNNKIQETVKYVYNDIVKHNQTNEFKQELYQLFEAISQQGTCYLHYYLQGFEEAMYTRQQVSLIENINPLELYEFEMNNLVTMMFELEKSNYPILRKLIVKPTLLNQTYETYKKLLASFTMEQIANQQQVKINTIEDHVLEILIKGYMTNYDDYCSSSQQQLFMDFYQSKRGERLKIYKEHFENLSYFQIKVLIVGIERGEISAS
ncbi:helix-turn-helix domain-containing protein [Staphylococcus simiae]|uniref:helix-turn-helix domain-containing protein n=1 Tax=Staphylococcus simiae TaxID=308354 RepID=UPI001A95DBC2|nr:helix-turn-helix domain-containing protein [Staphylococcus simiae]MBO1197886.1 helix-turn-helix domain-containing protein [Staphylococcus simiae]MBO1200077.1 helix-turn-helix domain-containing protein [Staphylococcus simiae]MBO1202350.1 helix-turn-helix domain-containing protein [Staphylococcus simiae]MBO1209877.1 helix-turn-helix domain-containing protein [Staphylococcus simiae]MBO1228494.1 helix-turn-helix domain-containing protein [Staphylococcus simiae]